MKRQSEGKKELSSSISWLKHKNAELYTFLDSVPSIILAFDLEGKITYINKFTREFFDYTPEEMIGLVFYEHFIPERLVPYTAELYKKVMAIDTHESFYVENWAVLKNQEERFIAWTTSYLLDKNGKPYGTVSVGNDITEISRANERNTIINDFSKKVFAINNRQEFYKACLKTFHLFTNCHFSILYETDELKGNKGNSCLICHENDVSDQNESSLSQIALDKKTGLHPMLKSNQKYDQVKYDDNLTLERNSQFKAKLIASGIKKAISISLKTDSNIKICIRLYYKNQSGENTRGLDDFVAELKQLVNLFTIEEASKHFLKKSKEQAELASQAKSSFLANISHEVRTPMNSILGYVQLLRERKLNPSELKKALEVIEFSGHNLLAILDDILSMTRLETGQVKLKNKKIIVKDFFQEIIALFKNEANEKGLSITLELDPSFPKCLYIDEGKLRQILINLISNAIKFTKEGSIMVHGRLFSAGKIKISVADTGIGIAKKDQERIFEPFTQASTEAESSGTGLGLSICKSLIGALNGEIQVISKPFKGTKFRVFLPLNEIPKITAKGNEGSTMNSNKLKILVLASKKDLNSATFREMMKQNIQLSITDNKKEAHFVCIYWEPDIILIDFDEARYRDKSFIGKILSDELLDKPTLIAYSSNFSIEKLNNMFDFGIDSIINKPLKTEKVFERIAKYHKIELIKNKNQKRPRQINKQVIEEYKMLTSSKVSKFKKALLEGDITRIESLTAKINFQKLPALSKFLNHAIDSLDLNRLDQLFNTNHNE